jgi:hypothetical protein
MPAPSHPNIPRQASNVIGVPQSSYDQLRWGETVKRSYRALRFYQQRSHTNRATDPPTRNEQQQTANDKLGAIPHHTKFATAGSAALTGTEMEDISTGAEQPSASR